MLTNIRTKILPALWPALAGALLSIGLVVPVMRAFSLPASGYAIAAAILMAVFCGILSFLTGKWRALYVMASCALLLLWLSMSGGLSRLAGMLSALLSMINGDVASVSGYAAEISAFAGAFLSLIGYSFARQSAGFYPALSMSLIAVLIIWFTGHLESLWTFLPALFVLCALFSHAATEVIPRPRTLLVSIVIAMVAIALTPAIRLSSDPLESFASQLRNYITDTFFFTEPRTVYSIQLDGYKPLENRLGGPVDIPDRPVMLVRATRPMLLRGTIYNEYNGLNWGDTLSNRRYLYRDFRYKKSRADVMDEERPALSIRDAGMFEPLDVKVTMQATSVSTLFVPLRSDALETPTDMVPYFNASSEVFTTRDLAPNDAYSVSAPVIALDDPRLPGQIAQGAAKGERRAMDDYLRVPSAVATEVRELAARITADSATQLDKAMALYDHLRRNYPYTLSPSIPPDNQDFVSHFLLIEKQGYCTYFASAMAIMGRLVGLPTRYVEGYLAEPSGDTAFVTSKSAHAWAEVYFDGFGWVTFDATPPHGTGGQRPPDQMPEDNTSSDEQEDGQDPDAPTPMDEKPPEESPAPEKPDQDDSTDDADNPDDDPSPTPTPTPPPDEPDMPSPTATPTPPPPDAPNPPDSPDGDTPPPDKNNFAWIVWLIALLLLLLVCVREYITRPQVVAERRCKDDADRMMAWYRALLGLLEASGTPAMPHETPAALAFRLSPVYSDASGIIEASEALMARGYGHKEATADMVAAVRNCYVNIWKASKLRTRIVWTFKRTLHGIGSVKQVP